MLPEPYIKVYFLIDCFSSDDRFWRAKVSLGIACEHTGAIDWNIQHDWN